MATQRNHRDHLATTVCHSALLLRPLTPPAPRPGQLWSNVNALLYPDAHARHLEFRVLDPDGHAPNTSYTLSRHQRDAHVRFRLETLDCRDELGKGIRDRYVSRLKPRIIISWRQAVPKHLVLEEYPGYQT